MIRDQLGKRVLFHIFGRNDAARIVHIGQDTADLRQRLQLGGQRLFTRRVAARHHQHIGVALAEHVLDGLNIRAQLRFRAENVRRAVIIAVLLRAEIGGHGQHQQDQQHGDHQVCDASAEPAEGWHERTMAHPFQQRVAQQDQRGRKQEHGEQADGHALAQHQAHVRPDLKLHQAQRQKADHGGQAAGQDGHGGFAQRFDHGLVRLGRFPSAFLKAVQQEDGIVQRNCQLQNTSRRVGHERNFAKDQVAAAVDQYGHAQADQHHQRLQPGGGRQHQDKQHERHGGQRNDLDLRYGAGRGYGGRHGGAAHGVVIADQLSNRIHGCDALILRDRD